MKKNTIMKFVLVLVLAPLFLTLLSLTLLSACGGGGTDVENNDLGKEKPAVFAIHIYPTGNAGGDSISVSPASGNVGDEITINYTLGHDGNKIFNRLTFSGTSAAIAEVDKVETGTRTYTIAEADAVDGVITIIATFAHSNKKIVRIMPVENKTGDSVSVSPDSGDAGDIITINYTLGNDGGKVNNRLTFSGTTASIAEVDEVGTGTRTYTIADEDAADGIITIIATFAHSNKDLDTIAFADTENERKTYGDNSNTFTKAISNSGSGTGAITYESSDETVATVNSSTGEVTILKVGNTTIKATKAEDATYEHATAEYLLTVDPLQLTIANPTLTTTKVYDGTNTSTVTATGTLSNIVGSDDVSVSAVATYASANAGSNITITVVYTITGDDAGNYIKPVDYQVAGTITKATGAAVSGAPTMASKTHNTITSSAVTIPTNPGSQTVEYAINTSTTAPVSGWQDSTRFTGLDPSTGYYLFARSKEDANHNAGTSQVSALITTDDIATRTMVIDFDNIALGDLDSTQNNSNASSKATISLQPNDGGYAAQVALNNWQQGLIIPVYLPSPLNNYEKVTFKFKATTTANMGTNAFMLYAAENKTTFTGSYGWLGNTGNTQYTSNLVGTKTHTTHTLNVWEDHEITVNPVSAIQNLQGNIFIAIGFNQNSGTYQLDNIVFYLKDTAQTPAPYVTPASASFIKAEGFKQDIPITMTLFGKTLTGITNGSALSSGTDYTIDGNTVTLKTSYLDTFAGGTTQTLTFNFSDSTSKTVTISILTPRTSYNFVGGDTVTATFGPQPLGAGNTGSRTSIENVASIGTVLQVNINRQHDVLVLPFVLVGDKLKDFNSINIVVRRLDGNNDNGEQDLNYKELTFQIPGSSGNFTAGNGSNTAITASSASYRFEGNQDWKNFTIPLNSAGKASELTGAVNIALYAAAFKGKYQIQSISLVK